MGSTSINGESEEKLSNRICVCSGKQIYFIFGHRYRMAWQYR